MDLGIFSMSLTVKDIRKSIAFYEILGFEQIGGDVEQNWVIIRNGDAKIGLFQEMFDNNILTFHPPDARGIQKELKEKGVQILKEADEEGSGPAHLALADPDGNMILIDQFE